MHLYEHDYKGCVSCFECKRIGGKSYGKCAVTDGISEILDKSLHADCLVFGAPIYFSDVTGMMRCYWERLFFPVLGYDKNSSSLAPQKVRTGFVYTMNAPVGMLEAIHYPERLKVMEDIAARMLGHAPLWNMSVTPGSSRITPNTSRTPFRPRPRQRCARRGSRSIATRRGQWAWRSWRRPPTDFCHRGDNNG